MSNTLTPFLYQTRTLSRLAIKAARSTPSRSGIHNTSLRRRQDYNDIPFELPPDVDRKATSVHESGLSDTLTPDEREIFGNIFNEIAQHGKKPKVVVKPDTTVPTKKDPAKGAPQFLAGLIAGSTSSSSDSKKSDPISAAATANAIMEDAANRAGVTKPAGIRGLDPLSPLEATYSADEREKALLQFPPTLRKAARQAFGMFNVFEPTQTEDGGQEALGTAPDHPDPVEAVDAGRSNEKLARTIEIETQRRHERLRILARMETCVNDFELWEVMEKEVFSLVNRLGITEVPANPDFQPKKIKKRGRMKKGEAVEAEAVAEAVAIGGDKMEVPQPSAKGELDMEIYGPIYPQLLLDGLNFLGTKFARPSPYTTHLLTRVKQLGLVSYVLGVSTAFYNRLMLILWNRFGDAHGVLGLLEEMRHAGLFFDEDSFSVVSRIQTMYIQADRGERGRFVRELMGMPEYEPVVAQRLSHWAGTIDASIRERRLGKNF
ncbi:hypothetical protein N0V93_008518 [Gnomoniopsis smithogilvyi]|uniref:Mtf2-like C-terminal domain-containing protein n=1 Tax=Gnomoniopsis smithogilvyi TaxID=1191159 RepID=A0A9W9CTS3_9PEZI|nr:hypothetical protein N0V93_008518 [Gnomoniopsis smithogilvyi]